ncbi:MAG: sporulation protein YqfD [Clostridia bacterium]|nr:sporulation protein YqfD [Clostridia bacterium]
MLFTKPLIKITVKGLNRKKLYKKFEDENIALFAVKEEDKSFTFGVRIKDRLKAVAILENMCYNYTVTDSLSWIINRFFNKLQLFITGIIVLVLLFVSNIFVWKIEIIGVDGSKLYVAKETLADNNIFEFTPKSQIDLSTVKNALLSSEFSSASLSYKGNTLEISVTAKTDKNESLPQTDKLLSRYDGVVTKIIARCGTPVVKVGQVVKRGDVLITDEIYSTLDGSVIGKTKADGEVFANVTFSYSYPISVCDTLVFSGESYTQTDVQFFGIGGLSDDCKYKYFDKVITLKSLYPLPIKVYETKYYELVFVKNDDLETFAQDKCRELETFFGGKFEYKYDVVKHNAVALAKVYFTAELLIGDI